MVTRAGNSTTIPPMTATDACEPFPKIRMITGARAMSGTERSSIATGMSALSAPFETRKRMAPRIATTRPTMKPVSAWPMVTPRLAPRIARFAAASSSTNRKSQTSSGPLAMYGEMPKKARTASQISSTITKVESPMSTLLPTARPSDLSATERTCLRRSATAVAWDGAAACIVMRGPPFRWTTAR